MTIKNTERTFGLSPAQTKTLQAEYAESKKLPNAHQKGCYRYIVAALTGLGVNKSHALDAVFQRFQREAGAEWFRAWASREGRNEKTGKNAHERFVQNLKVLQRTRDYGRKLMEIGKKILKTKGVVVDLSHGADGTLMVTLNTNSNRPMLAGRMKVSAKPGDPAGELINNAAGKRHKAKGKSAKAKKPSGRQKKKASKE